MSMKTRLLLWLLCVPLGLALLLSTLALTQDARQRHAALEARLTTSAELLAPALADALEGGHQEQVASLLHGLLAIEEVRAAAIRRASGEALMTLGPVPLASAEAPSSTRLLDHADGWRLMLPLDDAYTGGPWLDIDIDSSALALVTYQRLLIAWIGCLIAGLLLFLLAYGVSRRFTRPLETLGDALARLNGGDYQHRLALEGSREGVELSTGLNVLAERLQRLHDDREGCFDRTTRELQASMATIEAKNFELDEAHRQALEASRVKSQFLASVSHEIRTPLNGIIGFCRLLGRSRLEPRQREWLDHMHRASDSLLALINDILDFSKLEAGKLKLERVELDMVTLVDETLGLQAPLAHQKGLHLLGVVFDDVPARLAGDPLRIKQVLTNLVHNAIKFTDAGEVIVRVRMLAARDDLVTLRVSVSDTGIGLPRERRDLLFRAFSQAHLSDSRQYGGTGLGLLICRQLVDQMGGEISVDGEPGHGTTFAFTLPLVAQQWPRDPELCLEGLPVALYEPHLPTRYALAHLLERWGARVHAFGGALSVPEGPAPALLLAGLDSDELEAPSLTSWQACLNDAPCPSLLLINADPLAIPGLTLPHGGEILTKPLRRDALADALRRRLDLRTGNDHEGPAALPAPALAGQARVLIVDDTPSNRTLLGELLKELGLEARETDGGEQALALARHEAFDLVLMDIHMPGMDGVATLNALRRLGGCWRHCPVIAVTAHALEDERRRLLDAGMKDVLIKPVDADALTRLLSHHLGMTLSAPARPTEEAAFPGGELPVVDMALGTRLAGGRQALAEDTLAMLREGLDDDEAELRRARQAQDQDALLEAVHRLNGASRYCGVPQLALLAETLETRLRVQGLAAAEPLLDELFTAMARLRAWPEESHQDSVGHQPSSTTKASASESSSDSDR